MNYSDVAEMGKDAHDPHNYCPNCGAKMDLEALQ